MRMNVLSKRPGAQIVFINEVISLGLNSYCSRATKNEGHNLRQGDLFLKKISLTLLQTDRDFGLQHSVLV